MNRRIYMRWQNCALLVALILPLGGCAAAGGAIGAMNAASGVSAFSELRRVRNTPSPIAGTYRITYSWGEGELATIYARTYEKPVAPMLQDAQGTAGMVGKQETVGYMLLANGAAVPEQLATTMAEIPGKNDPQTGAGIFYVSEKPVLQPDSTQIYYGSIMVELAPGQSKDYDRFAVILRNYQELSKKENGTEQTELPAIIRMNLAGRVLAEQTVMLNGKPYFSIHAERLSTDPIVN